jgi:hypothetical protein
VPDSGRLLRITGSGSAEVLLDRINYPAAIAFSHSGDLYLSVGSAFSGAGQGKILWLPCHTLGTPDACAEPTLR